MQFPIFYPDYAMKQAGGDYYFDEYTMNADGTAPNIAIEIATAQAALDALNNEQNALIARKQPRADSIAKADADYATRLEYWKSCSKRSSSTTGKKYKCGSSGKFEAESWYESEKQALTAYKSAIDSEKLDYQNIVNRLSELPKLVDAAVANLNKLRDSSYMAKMTPDERSQYDSAQKQAEGIKQASIRQAEITAGAQAEAIAAKSKQKTILVVGIAVALVAGTIVYFVTRKKGVKPIPKP